MLISLICYRFKVKHTFISDGPIKQVQREQLKKAGIFRRAQYHQQPILRITSRHIFTGDSRYESVDSLKCTMIVRFENRKVDGTEKLRLISQSGG